mgnify:CR=1 FL=1
MSPPLPPSALARRVLLAAGLGTALSLMGDAALYAVLPTHTAEAGVALASVGLLLSANRWVRLLTNAWAGQAYDRWPRRRLFVPALLLGAASTAVYALTTGFWPLLGARLLWGLAWSGIWVGGNTLILDVAAPEARGRLIGLYQLCFYLGTTLAAPLGGLLTDTLGFHPALGVAAVITGFGALAAGVLLPETRPCALRPGQPCSCTVSTASCWPASCRPRWRCWSSSGSARCRLAGLSCRWPQSAGPCSA